MKQVFYKHIILLLLFLVSISCSKKTDNIRIEKVSLNNLPEYILQPDTILRLIDPFAPELYLLNDTIIALTFERNGISLRLVNANNKETLKTALRNKRDRMEIFNDPNLQASLRLFNKANRIFYEYKVEDGYLRIDDYKRLRIGERSPYEAVKFDHRYYLGLGQYRNGLLGILDTKKNEMTYFGSFPVKDRKYTDTEFLDNYRGYLAIQDDQIIYTSELFGYLSSYEFKNGKLRKNWEKQISDFHYQPRLHHLEFLDDHQRGFEGVYMTPNYIYGLYMGYSKNSDWDFKNSLLVFDRNGNPVAKYRFHDMMINFAIDSKDEYVYATYTPYMNETWLVRFKLPKLINS